jgi:hypothetical protein
MTTCQSVDSLGVFLHDKVVQDMVLTVVQEGGVYGLIRLQGAQVSNVWICAA